MNTVQTLIKSYQFNRDRTLGLLEKFEQQPDPVRALGWRPGAGRAHAGWQFMHVAITEEIFATERLAPEKPAAFAELWPRFRGGSTPDDQIPPPAEMRRVLAESREHLLATLSSISEDRLGEIPAAMAARKLT
ncbi:MAG TPA: DinB family protein, partial [Pirellulales bacterium]|nr:DinB family protein [Pirellulales bacterium]